MYNSPNRTTLDYGSVVWPVRRVWALLKTSSKHNKVSLMLSLSLSHTYNIWTKMCDTILTCYTRSENSKRESSNRNSGYLLRSKPNYPAVTCYCNFKRNYADPFSWLKHIGLTSNNKGGIFGFSVCRGYGSKWKRPTSWNQLYEVYPFI